MIHNPVSYTTFDYNCGNTFVSYHCRPLSKTVKYNTLKVSKSARSKKAFSKF